MVKFDSFFLKRIFLIFFLFLFLITFSSALGITPASYSINFQPNLKESIDYSLSGANPNTVYSIYSEGDLSEYVSIDKKELLGDGSFRVNLTFPSVIEKPGKHTLLIGVKEAVDEELLKSTIGTAIEIKVLISVYVPYPGKYVEISSFTSEDVNIGESLEFKFDVTNRGKEKVAIFPKIEIFSNQSSELVETLYLEERSLDPTQKISLRKHLETSSFNSGRYNGVLSVEYGGDYPSRENTFFRIGELAISLKNYTNQFIIDKKIQKFNIEIESGWNDKIDGIYADVSLLNETSEILFFKTSSTNLNPWELKTITGYFDTSYFLEGVYDANITFFYYGKDVGKSSGELVRVEFIKKPLNWKIILGISIGLILLIALVIFVLKKYFYKK